MIPTIFSSQQVDVVLPAVEHVEQLSAKYFDALKKEASYTASRRALYEDNLEDHLDDELENVRTKINRKIKPKKGGNKANKSKHRPNRYDDGDNWDHDDWD